MDAEERMCSLENAYMKLREELNLLQSCLREKRIVTFADMDMRLHKVRWAAVKEKTGWSGDVTLLDIMGTQDLSCSILDNLGLDTLGTCRTASWLFHDLVEMVSMKGIVVCGGHGVHGERLRSAERFHPQQGTWESLPPMQLSKIKSASAVMGGHLYICGICGSGGDPGGLVQRLDRDTLTWRNVTPMPTLRCDFGAAAIGKHLYVCGGFGKSWDDDGSSVLSSVDRLVISTNDDRGRWETAQPMREQRRSLGVVAILGSLIVCGGCEARQEPKSSVEWWRPVLSPMSWSALSPMLEARHSLAAVALRSRVFVCGGLGESHAALTSTESYDLANGAWELLAPMQVPRHHHAAASTGNRVFVCGGHSLEYDGISEINGALDSCEQFDLVSCDWKKLPPMRSNRCAHVMVAFTSER